MIVEIEFRGIRTEETEYRSQKTNQMEKMTIHTLYAEQDETDSLDAIQLRLDDKDAAAFAGCKKGDRVKLDLTFRYVENRDAKIRGMLISRVRRVDAPVSSAANGQGRRQSAPPIPATAG